MGLRYTGKSTYKRVLRDAANGVTIEFEYSPPTARQVALFEARSVVRVAGLVGLDRAGAAIESLRGVLKGFAFPVPGESLDVEVAGQWVPLSSTPGEPGYRENWYQVLCTLEMKMLIDLGFGLFAGVVSPEQLRAAAESLAAGGDEAAAAVEASEAREGETEPVPLSERKPLGSA